MKIHLPRALGLLSVVLVAPLLGAACGGGAKESGAPGSTGGSSAPGGSTAAGGSAAAAATGPNVLGEKLTPRVIPDQQLKVNAGVMAVPASWSFEPNITWNYGWVSNPMNSTLSAVNPANEEAVFGFGNLAYFDLRPAAPYPPGQNIGGLIYGRPMDAVQALAAFVQQKRGREQGLTFVGSKDLPELPAALKQSSQGTRGVGVKVAYTLNGKPVEEEFYAIGYQVDIPYDGPQGRTYQINWGLGLVHSFRAPAGTLDARRPVFAAIVKSYRPNPEWTQRVAAVNKYLADQFNRQLQAGYDQIAAAAALSRQISANNDAMIASIESQRLAARTSGGGGADSSGAAKFDDYIRGVTTVDDPYYGTSQQSSNSSFHWTDGYGNYRNTNDVTYDPNRTEVGQWTPMKNIR